MSLKVDDFKSKLTGGGARANLFNCLINFPSGGGPTELTSFMCKGASIPGSSVASIDVPFRGRQIKVAGDRTFENWSATIINEASFEIRKAFESWLAKINGHESGTGQTNPSDYQADIEVQQLDRNNNVLATYKIVGAFPVSVGSIDLSYDSNDIEEFSVEFAYQYWTSEGAQ